MTFISWAPHCSRSDMIARQLGGTSHMVYMARLGSHPLTVGPKYLGQLFRTLRILFAEKPDCVFVMTPPVFACVSVWLYGLLRGVPYVIDTHTAAFMHPRWRHMQWLQRFVCRHAATTIVTNAHLAATVGAGGGRTTLVRDVPVKYEGAGRFDAGDTFNVGVVCSFNYDEPVGEIFEAARRLPDVRFHVTGNTKFLDRRRAGEPPPNLTFTGFLPDADYGALVGGVDVILTLTTRDHTMLRGAYEAVYYGTPIIISDWPVLRESFDEGTVHVDNGVSAIVEAIESVRRDREAYRRGVLALQRRKLEEWGRRKQELLALLDKQEPALTRKAV